MDTQNKIANRTRFTLTWTRLAIVIVAGLGLYLGHEILVNRSIRPPSVNCKLAELAETVPRPVHLALIAQDGLQRLVWIGPVPQLTIRSGPPCYVFDERGRLIDWCPETGEGWPLDYLAITAAKAQSISLDEALRWSNNG